MAIAGTVHVSQATGSDSNNGSTYALAKKTMSGGHTAATALGAGTKRILVWDGIFTEGDFAFGANDTEYVYIAPAGKVVFDGESAKDRWGTKVTNGGIYGFVNIIFENYLCTSASGAGLVVPGTNGQLGFVNCAFLATDVACQGLMKLNLASASGVKIVLGCTLYYLSFRTGAGLSTMRNCILKGCTDVSHGTWSMDFNAADDADFRGPNGWDIATYPPPWVGSGDFSFDPLHAQYAKYSSGGRYGMKVGASCWGGMNYLSDDNNIQSFMLEAMSFTNNALGAVVNDERYYETGVGPGPDGPSDAGPALLDTNGEWQIDLDEEPAAKSARVRSPVHNLQSVRSLKQVTWHASEASPGSVVSDVEVRGDSATFGADDDPSTTEVDWTPVARGTIPSIAVQYVQWRAVIRHDGV